jgi:hypothetical protein
MGGRPADLSRRLLLLGQVAVGGDTEVGLGAGQSLRANDREFGRFAGKFALLPDGLAFSLRVLLRDRRGKRRSAPAPGATFRDLPEALQLQALRAALAAEEAVGQADDDEQFRERLHQALKEMNVPLRKPSYDDVIALRKELKRAGLGELFPNAYARQRKYNAGEE